MRNKKRKGRLDFLPNRQNKYSIRRFTVGTASILIGATLIFGANSDAKAAEDTEANSSHSVGNNDKGEGSVKESTEAEAVSNPETTDTTSHDTQATETEASQASDETSSTEQSVQDDQTQEEATDVQSEQPSQHETKASNDDTSSSQVDPSTQQKEDQSTEETSNETDQVQTEETTQSVESNKEITQSSNNKVETQDTHADINKVEDRTSAVDYYAKTTGVSNEEAEQAIDDLNIDTTKASVKEIKQAVLFEALKKYSDEQNQNPVAVRGYAGFREADGAPDVRTSKTIKGLDGAYTQLGSPAYNDYYVGGGERVNTYEMANRRGAKSGFLLKDKVSFAKDFTFSYDIANNEQRTSTNGDGWGFMFAGDNINKFTQYGGITSVKGLPNAVGFKIDTHFNPGERGYVQPEHEMEGYASFVKNDDEGTSHNVGPHSTLKYADRVHRQIGVGQNIDGANLNKITLSYKASTGVLTANYLNQSWSINVSELGLDKNKEYNYAVTSTNDSNVVGNTHYNIAIDSALSQYGVATPARDYHPGYDKVEVNLGGTVKSPQIHDKDLPPGTKFVIYPNEVPTGWTATVNENTGEVTATPPANAKRSEDVHIPVHIIYPKNYSGALRAAPDDVVVDAPIHLNVTDAETYSPAYHDETTFPAVTVKLPQIGDSTVPSGSRYELAGDFPVMPGWTVIVDANSGEISVTPPEDALPGTDQEIRVRVTYPDGSSEKIPAKVSVVASDAYRYNPGYDHKVIRPGETIQDPQTQERNIPANTRFGIDSSFSNDAIWTVSINETTGELTVKTSENAKPGEEIDVPVRVYYPDGTVDKAKANIRIVADDAYNNSPGYD